MTRLTLSVVCGLGVLGGLLAQTSTASAAFPVTAANCGPGYRANGSAFYTPYGRSVANSLNSYDRYGYGNTGYGSYDRYSNVNSGYDRYSNYGSNSNCSTNSAWDRSPNSRYGSWDNNARYSDYSRGGRVRDTYLDRNNDYRHDHYRNNTNYRY